METILIFGFATTTVIMFYVYFNDRRMYQEAIKHIIEDWTKQENEFNKAFNSEQSKVSYYKKKELILEVIVNEYLSQCTNDDITLINNRIEELKSKSILELKNIKNENTRKSNKDYK